jgi:hypothetical protein
VLYCLLLIDYQDNTYLQYEATQAPILLDAATSVAELVKLETPGFVSRIF